jgi:hypothetical protein
MEFLVPLICIIKNYKQHHSFLQLANFWALSKTPNIYIYMVNCYLWYEHVFKTKFVIYETCNNLTWLYQRLTTWSSLKNWKRISLSPPHCPWTKKQKKINKPTTQPIANYLFWTLMGTKVTTTHLRSLPP